MSKFSKKSGKSKVFFSRYYTWIIIGGVKYKVIYKSFYNTCGTHSRLKEEIKSNWSDVEVKDPSNFINPTEVYNLSNYLNVFTKTFCRYFIKVDIPIFSEDNIEIGYQTFFHTVTRADSHPTFLIRRIDEISPEEQVVLNLHNVDRELHNKYFFEVQYNDAMQLPISDSLGQPMFMTGPIAVPKVFLNEILIPFMKAHDLSHIENKVFPALEQELNYSDMSVEDLLKTKFYNGQYDPLFLGKFNQEEYLTVRKSFGDFSDTKQPVLFDIKHGNLD